MYERARAKVLLVDDRPENLIALEAMLEPEGFQIVKANSGTEALKHLLTDDFSVILLDVQMPGMDGFETASMIKQRERSRHIPIIFITALSFEDRHVFQGYSVGAVDYMAKPLNPDILISKVRVFVELFEKNEEVLEQADLLRRQQLREAELHSEYMRDRRIAEVLQKAMLMSPPQDQYPGVQVVTRYEAASNEANLGGDFFDVFKIGPQKLALVVGDVSGKGLQAAARTAEVKFTLRAFLKHSRNPAQSLQQVNAILCSSDTDVDGIAAFTCVTLVVLNLQTGAVEVISGGMEPPFVLDAEGNVRVLEAKGFPLGVQAEAAYSVLKTKLRIGDTIVAFTDGVTEARKGYDLFGYDRVGAVAAGNPASVPLDEVGDQLLCAAREFAGGKLQDDACLLLARRVAAPKDVGSPR
ncbi:MAG: SpoIIE family protein phosphatase [Capsulimonas sp.]|nr:SpoIIE family protein phosphatase [Capsulimonas sp.]